jgi:hypothetical protein
MSRPRYIPANYKRIQVVGSLTELFNASFGGPAEINCILYPRRLSGDFNALAAELAGIRSRHIEDILSEYSEDINSGLAKAAGTILEDMRAIRSELEKAETYSGLDLRIERRGNPYPGESPWALHKDGAHNASLGRILCCYTDPVTEWARNEDVQTWKVGLYKLKPEGKINRFRPGDIWRLSVDPECPFVHRVPASVRQNDPPRIVLVAG